MNRKDLRQTYFRLLKFSLIGIIPNIILTALLMDKIKGVLLSLINIVVFASCATIGEMIYNHKKNRETLEEMGKANKPIIIDSDTDKDGNK